MNDHEKARRLREKGWSGPSASEKAKGGRFGRRSEPASGGVEEALRNFDANRPKETAIPRSDESAGRARSHKFRLPRLG